jgi:hypothetical protein
MDIPYFLKVVLIFGALLAVIPLAGLATFGNWRQAWAYSKQWGIVVGSMIALAGFIALLFQ